MNTTFKHRRLLGLALVIASLSVVSVQANAQWFSGWGTKIEGSGNIQKQERSVKDFRAVSISVPSKVELRQAEQESVVIEVDDNILAMLDVVVEGGTLKIRTKEKNVHPQTKTFNIWVNLKKLDEVALESSGKIISNKLLANDLKVRLGGSGHIEMNDLKADSLKVTIGGSGKFVAQGVVPQIAGAIGGSGDLDMQKLLAKDVRVSIGGSGSVITAVSDNLNVSIGGSGNVNYYGDPHVTKSIGGSGSVNRKGSMP